MTGLGVQSPVAVLAFCARECYRDSLSSFNSFQVVCQNHVVIARKLFLKIDQMTAQFFFKGKNWEPLKGIVIQLLSHIWRLIKWWLIILVIFSLKGTLSLELKLRRTDVTKGNPIKLKIGHSRIFPFDHKQKLYTHAKFYLSGSPQNALKGLTE